jgi:hypothetical protein
MQQAWSIYEMDTNLGVCENNIKIGVAEIMC